MVVALTHLLRERQYSRRTKKRKKTTIERKRKGRFVTRKSRFSRTMASHRKRLLDKGRNVSASATKERAQFWRLSARERKKEEPHMREKSTLQGRKIRCPGAGREMRKGLCDDQRGKKKGKPSGRGAGEEFGKTRVPSPGAEWDVPTCLSTAKGKAGSAILVRDEW